ncbi:hypothetical protein HDU81_010802 [Chytriomyces hyalinus]|nr:hypothetical protein HDU81_010802 [Chytriomyces hyalinus]
MTTNAASPRTSSSAGFERTSNKFSLYCFWQEQISWTVSPLVDNKNPFDPRFVSQMLLKFCITSLFGNRGPENIDSDLDLVSTSLVMVRREGRGWQAFMTEPMVIAAGVNYMADQYPDAISNYFASTFLAPVGGASLTPQERGNQMELIIAIRFMQEWWKEDSLKAMLPQWAQKLNIPKPKGILDCRVNEGPLNMFIQQLRNSNFPWVICPPTNAGPDLRYNIFSCCVKTTSTPSSYTTMQITSSESKKNLETTRPVNWYSSQKGTQVYADCLVEVEKPGRRFIHMRFELPDTASNDRKQFHSRAVGEDYVICVNLESKFALKFFGVTFVTAYKKFVQSEISKYANTK